MENDCFLDNVTVNVYTRSNGNGAFLGRDASIDKDTHKLMNPIFNVFLLSTSVHFENGESEFYETMSHEIQHAYRFLMINLSNNSNYSEEERLKKERYTNAVQGMYSNDIGTFLNRIYQLYYLSERDEISSEANKLYEHIRQNEDINSDNYREQYKNMPLYPTKMNLMDGIEMMDNNIKNEAFVEKVGELYKGIMKDDKSTNKRAFMKFRQRLIDSYMFASRCFYRTLNKAFNDFNRYTERFKPPMLTKIMKFDEKELEGLDDLMDKWRNGRLK